MVDFLTVAARKSSLTLQDVLSCGGSKRFW
jgi:hypothetical protein